MHWISDVAVGEWLRARLEDHFDSMHGVVPRGYAAYARVFHPASVQSLPDRAVPTQREYARMSDAEIHALIDQLTEESATWAQAAAAFGTTMHPLAQWMHLVRTPADEDWHTRIAPDGREFSAPAEGEMDPALLALIAGHLTAHTTTPDAGVAAIWAGYGGLLGFFGETPSRAFLSWGVDGAPARYGADDIADAEPAIAPSAHQQMLQRSIHDPFNHGCSKQVWQPGILSDEISKGPQLELPGREYVLFSAPPTAFADADWVLDATWRDRAAEAHGFPPAAQHPNILWPTDHAWTLVSEIDYDSTIIGGSADLITEICADPRIEAAQIPPGSDLTWQADQINR